MIAGAETRKDVGPSRPAAPHKQALLTYLWVIPYGELWWSTAEAEHGQGDKCVGTAESERDAGDEPDLGVCRYLEPRAVMALLNC